MHLSLCPSSRGGLGADVTVTNSPLGGITNSATGDTVWSQPENIKVSDGSNATASVGILASGTTHWLQPTNFHFNIPSNALIKGIEAFIKRGASQGTVTDSTVHIVKNESVITTTNKARSGNWPTTAAVTTYGGPTDLWGQSWMAADVNNPTGFSWVISASLGGGVSFGASAEVDHMYLAVTYSVPPTISNDGGASNILATSADLNGNLTSTGTAATAVYVYWGTNDAGTVKGEWVNTNYFGVRNLGLLTTNITGLIANNTYYYRSYATNAAGEDWADSSAIFTTVYTARGTVIEIRSDH